MTTDDEKLKGLTKEADSISSKISKLNIERSELNEQLKQIRLEIIRVVHGVQPGSIVVDIRGKLHRVVEVEVKIYDPISWIVKYQPWVMANPARTDGTYGKAIRHLYTDWELVG